MKKRLRPDIEEDSQLLSNTSIDYASAVRNEYEGLRKDHTSCQQPIEMPEEGAAPNGETEISEYRRLRRMSMRLVNGG